MAGARKTTEPKASRGRRDRRQTEERMLVAAQRLFADYGFHAVSVRDIAAEAGVSHALVHRYLGGKEAILAAAMRRNTGPVLNIAAAAASASEAVPAMFRELRTSRQEYLKLLARMGLDRVSIEAVRPEFPAYVRLIELLKADAAQRGCELPDARVLAASLTALVIGWAVTEDWLIPASDLDDVDGQVIEASLAIILRSMVDSGSPPATSR